MRTILAPVNFTENSTNAARYAADMALAANAELYLLHVVQIPISVAEFPVNDFVFEDMLEAGKKGLDELRDELMRRTEGRVRISLYKEIGGVESKIEQFCQQHKPLVVVMGASGSGLEALLTGTHLGTSVQHLLYPLMVIPPHAAFRLDAKILLACDLEDLAGGLPVKASFLKDLQEIFQARFEVININTKKELAEVATVFESDTWKECIRNVLPEIHFVVNNKVEEGIGQYLAEHPADLLLVFPKKHSFLEFHRSQAKKIALHGKVPVMSIHA